MRENLVNKENDKVMFCSLECKLQEEAREAKTTAALATLSTARSKGKGLCVIKNCVNAHLDRSHKCYNSVLCKEHVHNWCAQ